MLLGVSVDMYMQYVYLGWTSNGQGNLSRVYTFHLHQSLTTNINFSPTCEPLTRQSRCQMNTDWFNPLVCFLFFFLFFYI